MVDQIPARNAAQPEKLRQRIAPREYSFGTLKRAMGHNHRLVRGIATARNGWRPITPGYTIQCPSSGVRVENPTTYGAGNWSILVISSGSCKHAQEGTPNAGNRPQRDRCDANRVTYHFSHIPVLLA